MTAIYTNDAKGVHGVTENNICSGQMVTPPLTTAQIKRRAAYAALLASLKPNASHFMTPINTGPLNVKRATGINASV